MQPTSGKLSRLVIFVAALGICTCCGGPVFFYFWASHQYADPGPLEHLHGKGKAEVVQELGEPWLTESITLADLRGSPLREKFQELIPESRNDASVQFLHVAWVNEEPSRPSLAIDVWFRQVDGQWVSFYSYRHYKTGFVL